MQRISLMITDQQRKALKAIAKRTEVKVSEQIRTGINLYLERESRKQRMQFDKDE